MAFCVEFEEIRESFGLDGIAVLVLVGCWSLDVDMPWWKGRGLAESLCCANSGRAIDTEVQQQRATQEI
jgi:hypothetical protein